jgi:prepilin-type N-terminal cleavage/methylation domain-containing protein
MFSIKNKKGFTLIELMVALSIFTMVMVAAVGATVSALSANKRARAAQAIIFNLNYAIETMTRNIRYGKDITIDPSGKCVDFKASSDGNKDYTYCFAGQTITLLIQGESSPSPVISEDEVNIGDSSYFSLGTGERSLVNIFIAGEVKRNSLLKDKIPFSLRTAASSRVPNF